jgi:hypothetical protein
MWFGILTLATALIISISAAYYSILGLTAIFAAAFWPIVILGSSLEVGKVVSTLWLHKYWNRAELQYKVYLCSAVAILMLLTSMGVFGFLSKAHSDQSMISGDVVAKISIYDEKIRQSRDNIDMARRALQQMDAAVDQTMSRSTDEKGADKAAQLRRSQANERNRLLKEIDTEQKKIQTLNDERAPIAAEVRKVEAEVGPIKYIAALIYGDNPEANVLEKAVRWVIILIVIVFDPLALTLLLAATKTLEWERKNQLKTDEELDPEVRSWFDQARERARFWDQQRDQPKPEPWPFPRQFEGIRSDSGEWTQTGPEFDVPDEQAPAKSQQTVRQAVLAGLDNMWTRAKKSVKQDAEAEHAPLQNQPNTPSIGFTNKIRNVWDHFSEQLSSASTEVFTADSPEKIAERAWKSENPDSTLKSQRELLKKGKIDQLPWKQPEFLDRIAGLEINTGYGKTFPANPSKGDMFVKIDTLPSVLHKFNGTTWMQLDKDNSDTYTQNTAYIDYLIEKISTGEYDPELLSESERISIEQRLNQII